MLLTVFVTGVIGGLINLDVACVGQLMLSRPLVSAPLTGAILGLINGDIEAGLICGIILGMVLELFWIRTLPIGASIPANAGLSAVVAVPLSLNPDWVGINNPVLLALVFSILAGFVAGRVDILVKRINLYLAYYVDKSVKAGNLSVLSRINWAGLTITFLVGFLFSLMAVGCGEVLIKRGTDLVDRCGLDLSVFLPLFLIFGISSGLDLFIVRKGQLLYFGVAFLVTVLFLSLWR